MSRVFFLLCIFSLSFFSYPGVLDAKKNTPPVAIPGGPYEGTTNAAKPILFDGSASYDADGDLLEYSWDFGDGTAGAGETISHAYAQPGVFTVSLTVDDGTATNTETTTATVSLRAPLAPNPASGAPFIALPLILGWEDVLGAQSYRYELIGYKDWLQAKTQSEKDMWTREWTDKGIKDWMADGIENGFLTTLSSSNFSDSSILKFLEPWYSAQDYQKKCKESKNKDKKDKDKDGNLDECADSEFRTFIKQQQQRFWHVKSCEDSGGTKCGPWGDVWDFTYLPGPAVLKTPTANAPGVPLPVTLDWDDMPGAKSYDLILLPCPPWGLEDPKTDCYSISIYPLPGEMLMSEYSDSKIPVFLRWGKTEGAKIYSYEISLSNEIETDGSFKNVLKSGIVPGGQEQIRLDYEAGVIEHNKEYWWHVMACTDEIGTACGSWSTPLQFNTFIDCLITRQSEYGWQVASCLDEQASFCTHPDDFSPWSFSTSNSAPKLPAPKLLGPFIDKDALPKNPATPENIPPVSKSNILSWSGGSCVYFSRINVFNETGARITNDTCGVSGSACTEEIGNETLSVGNIERLWDQSDDLGKTYSWSVTPCWSRMGFGVPSADCPPTADSDSEKWYFHTAGKPPTLTAPAHNTSTKIPILLSWQGDGVSYRYQVAKDAGFAQIAKEGLAPEASVEIAYAPPDIMTGTSYWWHVKTCVDYDAEKKETKMCGPWSETFQFTTFPLEAPSIPTPANGGQTFLTTSVSWNSVPAANFYQYHLEYACRDEKETSARCTYKTKVGVCPADGSNPVTPAVTVEEEKITPFSYFDLPYCMGRYNWRVRSCLDKSCAVAMPTLLTSASSWTLLALQPPSTGVGLVPCGKPSNEPATPYDETDPCQLKHVFLLLQNLLDFILWKVSLFTLLVLAVITGATSYFSLGGANTLTQIKTVFRSFFVGFLMLMFAWMFVNIVLMLFGFKFEFFGRWWEISF